MYSNSLYTSTRISWLIALCAAAILLCHSILFRERATLPATNFSDLQIEDIYLGEMRIGETRTLSTPLVNCSKKTLHLDAPITTCGCISLDSKSMTLAPQERIDLRLRFIAPMEPGNIDRKLIIKSSDVSNLFWPINVTGVATANVWAKPSRLSLTIRLNEIAQSRFVIHTMPGVKVLEVTSDSPALKIETLEPKNDQLPVLVSLREETVSKGEAVVSVVTTDFDNEKLSVNVKWSPFSKLACVPSELSLGEAGESKKNIRRTIVLRGLTGQKTSDILCTSLVDWLTIDRIEVIDRVARVDVTCDITRVPSLQRFDVVRLCITEEDRDCRIVQAHTLP